MSPSVRIRLTIGVIVVLLVVTPFLIPVNQFRPTIEQRASAAFGRRVVFSSRDRRRIPNSFLTSAGW